MDTKTCRCSPASPPGFPPGTRIRGREAAPPTAAFDARAASIAQAPPTSRLAAQIVNGGQGRQSRVRATGRRGPWSAPLVELVLFLGLGLAADAAASSHLRYFGFSGGCDTETLLQETAPLSNICVIDIQDDRLLDRAWVAKMMVRDVRLVVGTHDAFYEPVEVPGRPRPEFDLRADFRQRWQDAIAGKEAALEALAEFFYVADEPNWNGISRTELEDAHLEIKRSMPGARTVTSFNRMLDISWFEGWDVPTDAVAYHHYGVLDPRVDPDFQANVMLIKSYAPGKEFIYVMDSWWTAALHGDAGLAPADMAQVAENYYDMALDDPDAVGIVGFYWPSFSEGTGARDLPGDVKWTYWSIGCRITEKCLGPVGVRAEATLFLDGCSYFATLELEAPEGRILAAAMPRERSFGTWVLDEGNVVGGLKIQAGSELQVYPSVYTEAVSIIRIYDAADGHLVWESDPHDRVRGPIRLLSGPDDPGGD